MIQTFLSALLNTPQHLNNLRNFIAYPCTAIHMLCDIFSRITANMLQCRPGRLREFTIKIIVIKASRSNYIRFCNNAENCSIIII